MVFGISGFVGLGDGVLGSGVVVLAGGLVPRGTGPVAGLSVAWTWGLDVVLGDSVG